MSLVSQVSTALTRVGTEFKAIRTLIGGSGTATISALTTTDKTSLVAAINEVKAGSAGTPPDASATVKGIVELATDAEAITGTDTVRATTPANLTAAINSLVPAASETVVGKVELATAAETVTGTDNVRATHAAGTKAAIDARIDNGALGTSTTNAPSANAVKTYADALIAANDAMVFKGVIDASASPNFPASNRGDTYRISVAGKIGGASGDNVEVGDLLIALTDGTAAGTKAAVGAQWNISQTNIDGAVTGPASAVSANLTSFSGTSGKVVQDSGFSPSNAAIGAGSATVLPTSAAVKTYADGKQTLDATLTALAGLTTAADQVAYSTGVDAFSMTALTSFGRSLIDDADATTARATLSTYSQTEIGDPTTDLQAVFVAALA
jgi:hypothetical protein